MRKVILLLNVILFALHVYGQKPELIADFNVGPDDSFSEWNYNGIAYGDAVILPIVSKEYGEELAIYSDDELRILKDINAGSDGSDPKSFIIYKDLLYFVADNGVDGPAVWRTDGTESGTELFFESTETTLSPNSFIIARNGWMYYSVGSIVYRTDGILNERIFAGASFGFSGRYGSKNYCKYQNGIAIVKKNSDYSFSIIHIDDIEAIEIVRTNVTSYFAHAYGLVSARIGLMFSIDNSDNEDAIYLYDESNKSLKKYLIDGEQIPFTRVIDFNDEYNVCYISDKGYYAISGVSEEEQKLATTSSNSSISQGDSLIYSIYEGKLAILQTAPSWDNDSYILYTNGAKNGTSEIKEINNQYLSGMLQSKNYAFFVEGVSNNFQPNIIKINLETGVAEDLYTFEERSKLINSVRPIAIQDDYLYFVSTLDAELGAELYRIKVDISDHTFDTTITSDIHIMQAENEFVVESDEEGSVDISIFNSAGQEVYTKEVYLNKSFTIDLKRGVYYLHYSKNQQSGSKSILIQ